MIAESCQGNPASWHFPLDATALTWLQTSGRVMFKFFENFAKFSFFAIVGTCFPKLRHNLKAFESQGIPMSLHFPLDGTALALPQMKKVVISRVTSKGH